MDDGLNDNATCKYIPPTLYSLATIPAFTLFLHFVYEDIWVLGIFVFSPQSDLSDSFPP